MEKIDLRAHGFLLNEPLRKHILIRLHTVFGFGEYKVKIIITLLDNVGDQNETEVSCRIQIKVQDQSSVIAEYKTLDLFSAFDLAIERARLKISNKLNDEKNFRKQLEYKCSHDIFGERI